MNNTSDKILELAYRVCLFPAWIVEKSPRKIVRLIGLLIGFPWFFFCLPIMFCFMLVVTPLMIWEDV